MNGPQNGDVIRYDQMANVLARFFILTWVNYFPFHGLFIRWKRGGRMCRPVSVVGRLALCALHGHHQLYHHNISRFLVRLGHPHHVANSILLSGPIGPPRWSTPFSTFAPFWSTRTRYNVCLLVAALRGG